MKKDKLNEAITFLSLGLVLSIVFENWLYGLPLLILALVYFLEALKKPDQSKEAELEENQEKQ